MYRELLNIHDSLARTWCDVPSEIANDLLISAKEAGLSTTSPAKFANNCSITIWETIAILMFQKMTGRSIFLAGRSSIASYIWTDPGEIRRTFCHQTYTLASSYKLNEDNGLITAATVYKSLEEPVPECEFQIIPLRSTTATFDKKFENVDKEVLKELDLKYSTDVNNIFKNNTQGHCAGILSDLRNNRIFYIVKNAHDSELYNTLLILIAYTAQAYKVYNNLENSPESECFKKILYRIRKETNTIPCSDIVEIIKEYLKDTQFLKRDLEVLYKRLVETMNKQRIGSLQKEYEVAVENKNKFFQRYNDALLRQEDISRQLSIIRTHDYNDGLIDFMQRCPIICNITPRSNSLRYDVMQPFAVNDEDEFKRIYKNSIEYMIDSSLKPYITRLIEEIFFEHTLILYCQSQFCLDISNTHLSAITYAKNNELDALPMPHLYYYGCLGSHMNIIQRFMNEGNYVNAVEQSLEATRELNWSDSTVVDKFLTSLIDYEDIKCLARPDDPTNHFSIREYIQEVKKANETNAIN